jgi:type I restriction enzyme, S subunit
MKAETFAFGDVLEEVSRLIEVIDDEEYACAGVRLHGQGVFIREHKYGLNIKKKHVQHIVRSGDIVFSTLFAREGAFAVADQAVDGAILSEKFPTFRLRDDRLNLEYLKWFFRSGQLKRIAETQVTGIAAFSLSHLSKRKFLDLPVPVPSLMRQAEVVRICEQVIHMCSDIKIPLLQTQELLSSLTGVAAEEVLQGIPKRPFADLGEFIARNVSILPDDEYKQVTVAMNNRGLRLRRVCQGSEIRSSGQCRVEAGDLLFSRIDLLNGAIGFVERALEDAVVTRDFPVFRLTCLSDTVRRFLGFVFLTSSFKSQAQASSKGTTGRKKIKREQFLRLEVFWPSPDRQEQIVEFLIAVKSNVAVLEGLLSEQLGLLNSQTIGVIESLFAEDAGLRPSRP